MRRDSGGFLVCSAPGLRSLGMRTTGLLLTLGRLLCSCSLTAVRGSVASYERNDSGNALGLSPPRWARPKLEPDRHRRHGL